MIHFISGNLEFLDDLVYIKNSTFGIKAFYFGKKKEGDFYLYPYLDVNHNTIYYAAFDSLQQLEIFQKLLKIPGIGLKTASFVSTAFDLASIKEAIENNDIDFFTLVPGIGPKTAKKLIIELKDKISLEDLNKLDENLKVKSKIVKMLVNLGYSKSKVENALKEYEGNLSDINQVIQDLIKKI